MFNIFRNIQKDKRMESTLPIYIDDNLPVLQASKASEAESNVGNLLPDNDPGR